MRRGHSFCSTVLVVAVVACGGNQTNDNPRDGAGGMAGADNLGGRAGAGGVSGTGGYDICSGPESPPQCSDSPCTGPRATITEFLPGSFSGSSECLFFLSSANRFTIEVEFDDYVYLDIAFPKTTVAPAEVPVIDAEALSVYEVVGGVVGTRLLCDRDPTQSGYRAAATGTLVLDELVVEHDMLAGAHGSLELTLTTCTWDQAEATDEPVTIALTF